MMHPALIILDEATEGLAPLIIQDIWRVIDEIRADGIAMLMIDHDYRRVLQRSWRVLLLQKGRSVPQRASRDLLLQHAETSRYLVV